MDGTSGLAGPRFQQVAALCASHGRETCSSVIILAHVFSFVKAFAAKRVPPGDFFLKFREKLLTKEHASGIIMSVG